MPAAPTPRLRHSALEDGYALVIGCALLVQGLVCLHSAGLVTGGVAGIALLGSYIVPVPAGVLFVAINVPFVLFAIRALGTAFAAKTALVSVGVLGFSLAAPHVFAFAYIDPLFAALFGGTVIGLGILSLARHQAGVGGTGVMVLWLHKAKGWNAGRTQLAIDAAILLCALPVVDWHRLALSAVSAAAMSGVLIAFHRPGRYSGH